MVDSITFGCGAPTKVDMEQALLELKTKMMYVETVVEIMVLKIEKNQLEYNKEAGNKEAQV